MFNEIIQFNANKLQNGGGSGFGLWSKCIDIPYLCFISYIYRLVCRSIVELHGGKVSVHSDGEGTGCTFTVEIPICDSDNIDTANQSNFELLMGGSRRLNNPPNENNNVRRPSNLESVPSSASSRLSSKLLPFGRTQHIETSSTTNNQSHSRSISERVREIIPGSSTHPNHAYGMDLVVSSNSNASAVVSSRVNSTGRQAVISGAIEDIHNSLDMESVHNEMKDINLLIVDDADLNRKMIRRLLSNKVSHVDDVEDGLKAVQYIKSISRGMKDYVDVILMDYLMPNMDGPAATKEIRSLGYKGLIIGVTGNALQEDIDTFISNGADKVLIKPVNIEQLLSIISGMQK